MRKVVLPKKFIYFDLILINFLKQNIMKTKSIITSVKFLIVLLLVNGNALTAQISGNQVYGNSNNDKTNYNSNSRTVSVNDNTLSVTVKILLNKKADGFVLTLGLNQEAENVANCTTKINKRIDGFLTKAKSLGIKNDDFYIDFISQTKVYDFEMSESKANQYEKGFEIKKNIIITTTKAENLEKLIDLASEFEIYDIIKVDYFNKDTNIIHYSLFDEALVEADKKKEYYLKAFKKRIIGTPNATENFAIIFPKTQYSTYQAYESSEVQAQYGYKSDAKFLKRIERKNKTFYYNGISTDDFDKVINPNQTEVGIQYVLSLTVSYKIDTSI